MQTDLIDFFLETNMLGLLGPLAFIVAGFLFGSKNKGVALLFFIVDCVFMAQYADLAYATPFYYWQVLILLIGGFMVLIPAFTKR